jgi:hypothetical protein
MTGFPCDARLRLMAPMPTGLPVGAPSPARKAFIPGFALKGEVLSLACPRESTQREGHPEACPAPNLRFGPGFPALLGKTGARATRDLATLDYAQTGRELLPAFPAMLGCARRASKTRRYSCRSAAPARCPLITPGRHLFSRTQTCVPTPQCGKIHTNHTQGAP